LRVELRYGKTGLAVSLPDQNVAQVLRMGRLPVIEDVAERVRGGLREPLGAAPLSRLAEGRRSACVVVSDITRPVPNGALLPPLLDALQEAGLDAGDVLVLVATGLHRANTDDELRDMGLGEALDRGVCVQNHLARDQAGHTYLGETSMGIPAWVDTRYVRAELRILTGLVEPHLMAGYSGGRKAICPGLCDAETIMAWHSPGMLEPEHARQGVLAGNLVHEQALEVARLAGGAHTTLNVTIDEARRVTGVFVGDMVAAHEAAAAQARRQTRVTIAEPVDIVITSAAGYPLDLTFYQGIKGIVAAAPIVKPGGTIIIAQENSEGIGSDEFADIMLHTRDAREHVQRALAGNTSTIDQWQLHVLEKVLRKCEVLN